MNDVFILGAEFSKAIHSGMPTLADLTDEVTRRLQRPGHSLPQPLMELDNNIELWITYLSQRQPWLTEYENDSNKSLAGCIRHHIGAVIEEYTARASQTEAPRWLSRLIGLWHREQATVITLNYDTLVERASKQVQPYFLDVQARSGAGVWGEGSLKTFSFLKLHGSMYFNNETVRRLWREAGRALQEAKRVFIIGYSLRTKQLRYFS